MEENERNEGAGSAVITFRAPDKTFVRVFKNQSLQDLRDAAKRKAGIAANTKVRLAHLQGETWIDIEDDEDYEAFCAFARFKQSLEVSIAVENTAHSLKGSEPELASSLIMHKRKRRKQSIAESSAPSHTVPSQTRLAGFELSASAQEPSNTSGGDVLERERVIEQPRKKRKKDKSEAAQANVSTPTDAPDQSASTAEAAPQSEEPGIKKKRKQKKASSAVPVEPAPEPEPAPAPPVRSGKPAKSSEQSQGIQPVAAISHDAEARPKTKKRKRLSVGDGALSGEASASRSFAESVDPEPSNAASARSPPRKKVKKARSAAGFTDASDEREAQLSRKKEKTVRIVEPRDDASVPLVASAPLVEEVEAVSLFRKKSKRKVADSTTPASKPPRPVASSSATTLDTPMISTQSPIAMHEKKVKKSKKPTEKRTVGIIDASPDEAHGDDVDDGQVAENKRKSVSRAQKQKASLLPQSEAVVVRSEEPSGPSVGSEVLQDKAKGKKGRRKTISGLEGTSSSASERLMSPSEMRAVCQQAIDEIWARPQPTPAILPAATEEKKSGKKTKEKPGKSKLNKSWKPEESGTREMTSNATELSPSASSSIFPAPSTSTPSSKMKAIVDKKGSHTSEPFCPICLKQVSHLRYLCPVVLAGADSIRERIAKLKHDGSSPELLMELEVLLAKKEKKVSSVSSKMVDPVMPVSLSTKSKGPAHTTASHPSPSPIVGRVSARFPAGSEIAEVAVESNDEGSSGSDESDNESIPSMPISPLIAPDISVADAALDALLRGPPPAGPRKSVLAMIPSESNSESEDESGDEVSDLEDEDEDDREFHRLTKKYARADQSSDEEVPDVLGDDDDDAGSLTKMDPGPQNLVGDQVGTEQHAADKSLSVVPETPPHIVEHDPVESPDKDGIVPSAREGTVVREGSKADGKDSADTNESGNGNEDDLPNAGVPQISKRGEGESRALTEASQTAAKGSHQELPPHSDGGGVSPTAIQVNLSEPSTTSTLQHPELSSPETRNKSDDHSNSNSEHGAIEAATSPAVEDVTLPETTSGLTTTDPGDATSSIVPASSINALVEIIQSNFSEDKADGDDPADPIEPADDLLDPMPDVGAGRDQEDEDPIETEPEDGKGAPSVRPVTPLSAVKSPGTVQRMRDRYGRSGKEKDFPVLASVLFTGAAAQSTPKGGPSEVDSAKLPAAFASQPESTPVDGVPGRLTRPSTRRSTSGTAMPPPSDPSSSTLGSRPRGRPRLTPEEKARREAEKKAKREKAAVERAEKRRLERERKDEQKRRVNEEKALAKNNSKAPSSSAPLPSSSTSIAPAAAVVPSTPEARRVPQSSSQSVVKWTTLTQEQSSVDPDTSIFDELQSSSPVLSLPRASSSIAGELDKTEGADAELTPVTNKKSKVHAISINGEESARRSQQDKSDPLFLPGSSQYPETPQIEVTALAIGARLHNIAASSDDGQDEGIQETVSSLNRKGPGRSRSWAVAAPLHRLSDLASQQLFSPPKTVRNPSLKQMGQSQGRTPAREELEDDEDDDDDDDTDDSEDDDGKRSHIPKERRAGVSVQEESTLMAYAFGK